MTNVITGTDSHAHRLNALLDGARDIYMAAIESDDIVQMQIADGQLDELYERAACILYPTPAGSWDRKALDRRVAVVRDIIADEQRHIGRLIDSLTAQEAK